MECKICKTKYTNEYIDENRICVFCKRNKTIKGKRPKTKDFVTHLKKMMNNSKDFLRKLGQ